MRQLARLNVMLRDVVPHNALYREKLIGCPRELVSLEQLAQLPFSYKEDLQATAGNLSPNLTYDLSRYVRYHQTSGTRGRPLVVLDTAQDWDWFMECWQYVYDAAEITSEDRLFLAFSFGPFIGFWAAHDAAVRRGCLVVPGGGMNSLGRLQTIRSAKANVVLCTPSYALHLAEVARANQIDPADLNVKAFILAGEAGGSILAVRERIERSWGAIVYDHSGATEVGSWGYPDANRAGLHINEAEFIAEFLSLNDGGPAQPGEMAELVLTNLGRHGFPVIRYRTRDVVRPIWPETGNQFVLLPGGVLGRTDDMVVIRGVNVFPSAIEQILRSFPEIHEFRITATRLAEMDQLTIEVEDQLERPTRIAEELRLRLGLRIEVRCVTVGTLPRFEGKAKRFVDER